MTRPVEINQAVYVCPDDVVTLSAADLAFLKEKAAAIPRGRIRLCAHGRDDERLHEMFILLTRRTYIRPHRHLGKAESLHVLEGEADAVFFDDGGAVTRVVPLGPYGSGRTFYYRIASPEYHTLLLATPHLLFHEATLGPFRREETSFPDWAPPEEDLAARRAYLEKLAGEARRLEAESSR